MNRLLTLSFFLLPLLCAGQNYGLCMQVVAISGGSGAQANYDVSWTVGEVAILTFTGVDHKITQGFHQPDVCVPVSTSDLDLVALGIEVFPNPTTDYLTIRYTDADNASLSVEAFDLVGSLRLQPTLLQQPSGTILDANTWPAGIYFLRIRDNHTRASATIRIIRL